MFKSENGEKNLVTIQGLKNQVSSFNRFSCEYFVINKTFKRYQLLNKLQKFSKEQNIPIMTHFEVFLKYKTSDS